MCERPKLLSTCSKVLCRSGREVSVIRTRLIIKRRWAAFGFRTGNDQRWSFRIGPLQWSQSVLLFENMNLRGYGVLTNVQHMATIVP